MWFTSNRQQGLVLCLIELGKGEGLKRKWREIGPYSSHEEGWDILAKACEKNRGIQGELKFTGLDPSAPKTFSELFNAWLDGHAKEKLATWQDEERRYRLHLEKPLGKRKVAEIHDRTFGKYATRCWKMLVRSNRTVLLRSSIG